MWEDEPVSQDEEPPPSPTAIALLWGLPIVGMTDLGSDACEDAAGKRLMDDLDLEPGESGAEGLGPLPGRVDRL